uniref:Uncharacterized protein n=1 Tax=Mycolicibacterium sp. CBMA 213 TaxID=1968788 RepID=A0A1S6GKT1_9MYCO|nr:hypothetical protein pCBMA213_2_00104 [Mycolicibacterium sp. CBMA 213]
MPGLSERRPPARRRDNKISDFTMLVRVPGDPSAIRVFTAAAAAEAAQYAADTGGTVEDLPE